MGNTRSFISTDLRAFLMLENRSPLYLNAAMVRFTRYEVEGRSVRLYAECRPPQCHKVIDLIHSNDVHLQGGDVLRDLSEYDGQRFTYKFSHCQEVYREANLQDWYNGEASIINIRFVAHMGVGNV
jgi:hypothetical protein